MAEQTIIIHIKGYWRNQDKMDLPEQAGLFFVYEANYNPTDQTVDLLKLIYIGDADNIKSQILHREHESSWMDHVAAGHGLCFGCAAIDNYYRGRARAAYVITHQPPANNNSAEVFQFDTTTIVSNGNTALINPVITARKNKAVADEILLSTNRKEMIPVRAVQVSTCNLNDRPFH
jgi:hypothetical protein